MEKWFWLESIENAPKTGQPESASCDEIVLKVKDIVKRDASTSYSSNSWRLTIKSLLHSNKYIKC